MSLPIFLYISLTLTAPAEVVASWPKSNYINPETRGDGLFIVTLSLASLGIVVVSSRMYSRCFITKAIGIDDVIVAVALGFSIALSTMIIIGNKVYDSGRHIWDIPPAKFVGHRHNVWVSSLSLPESLTIDNPTGFPTSLCVSLNLRQSVHLALLPTPNRHSQSQIRCGYLDWHHLQHTAVDWLLRGADLPVLAHRYLLETS
jgi:hypothetical protein